MDFVIDDAAEFELEACSDQLDESVGERERSKVIRPVQFQSVLK